MMLPAFDCNALKNRLRKLDIKSQLVFGAICCERLLPNYSAFAQDTGWGDVAPIRHALDLVWRYIEGKPVQLEELNAYIASCESVAPDSEDFQSLYTSLAQDACFAVCGLLDYLIENDVNKIVQAATYATDSVDMYVQELESLNSNDPDLEQKILAHTFMQRELSQQKKDLESIEIVRNIDAKFVYQVRHSWYNNDLIRPARFQKPRRSP